MTGWLKRGFALMSFGIVIGIAIGVVSRMRTGRDQPPTPPDRDWPPFDVPAEPPAPRWVPPVDRTCPDGYPIKANANSGIFHVPGGRFYDRTVPERCYAEADGAVADGYRAAKA